uniref:Related to Origin recognition complex subunit 4 n=1 Tax=Melanopsichium pennsylvanicum 4 TaxID=1398559 RepID=A0A077QY82_9BASI|nr:related to Origin recognition complex subunit 4 [Melanopsichium pennsylvanicum 4]
MSTIKRKASTSPAPSATSQDAAIIDIQEPAQHLQPPHKRTALSTSTKGALRNLPLKTLETLLPLQKKQCLYTLVGGLPPVPSTSISTFSSKDQRVASTLTLAPSNEADDNADADASVFNPTSSITTKDKVNDDVRTAASVCVGLEEEWYNLHTMLHATVVNAESNSALLIGAAGSGKSLLVDSVLRSISQQVTSSKNSTRAPGGGGGGNEKPYYHVHLAGSIQINDRSAMKEMAQQLILQGAFTEDDVSDAMDEQQQSLSNQEDPSSTQRTGGADHVFGGDSSDDDDDDTPANLLTQNDNEEAEIQDELANAILSSLNNIIGHIINLLSSNTTKDSKTSRKPLLITLDNFDLFTARPRQAMLYCLLDAVQAASYGAGLAVVGMTGRVDSVDLLEKRVKSRFSHRILHVRPPSSFNVFERILRNALAPLSSPLEEKYRSKMGEGQVQNFVAAWEKDVASLFDNVHFKEVLKGVYELGNDDGVQDCGSDTFEHVGFRTDFFFTGVVEYSEYRGRGRYVARVAGFDRTGNGIVDSG